MTSASFLFLIWFPIRNVAIIASNKQNKRRIREIVVFNNLQSSLKHAGQVNIHSESLTLFSITITCGDVTAVFFCLGL